MIDIVVVAAVVLVVGHDHPIVAADPDVWFNCGATNYTARSAYESNLERLIAGLAKNASTPSLFGKGAAGAAPDTVYGVALCRGDLPNASACGDCVAGASRVARRACPLAEDVVVADDAGCQLRFSGHDILNRSSNSTTTTTNADDAMVLMNTENITQPMLPGWDPGNADSVAIITNIIKVLVQETARTAAYNSSPPPPATTTYYATGRMDVSATFPTLYSMAQCTPDLRPGGCWRCLQSINDMTTRYFAGRRGGRILGLWCNFRYETYPFYKGQPMRRIGSSGADAVAPAVAANAVASPPGEKHKRRRRRSKVMAMATIFPLLGSFCCVIFCFGLVRRYKKGEVSLQGDMNMQTDEEALAWGREACSSEFTSFKLSQVLDATNNFSEDNKLGKGGFGPVYKGQFSDGSEIAVKRLVASHSGQGFTEFRNEIQLIAKLQHTNLVKLLGCCYQGEEKILIYEYLPNKSLDFFIFDERRRVTLNWNNRLAIIEGIAHGLLYLHKHSRLRVIHRDLKASNILLDCEMNPKISDFGLARIFSSNDKEENTKRIVGTYGYMAPEYASEGLFSIKSDVFSFGVLILEIVSGKRNSGFHQCGDLFTLLGYMMRCINIALLCVQENAADRPTMSDVVVMLSSENMTLPKPNHPAYFHIRVTKEEASTALESPSLNDVTMSILCGR
uniref:non-specific serine/threonine protein kinase n=1 Tax=Oryza rufipogon TaxID=4529 RepID=A0A0E0RAL3_ORYRU